MPTRTTAPMAKKLRLRPLLPTALVCAALLPARALAAPTFTEIAREFTDGLMWLNADVRPALADDGTVLFAGSAAYDEYDGDVLFWGAGGALGQADPATHAVANITSLRINDAGTIVVVGDRAASETQRGVYRTSTAGGGFATVYEGVYDPTAYPSTFVTSNVALTNEGSLAFATIRNGAGAIYRGPVEGPLQQLRTGSGIFYNVRELDLNEVGQVPVQMEYTDPTAGLRRGILIFETPGQELMDIDTAVERLSIGMQPMPAINASGQVAFAINSSVTLLFFDPPGVYSDPPALTMTLEPGVYVSTPTPFGEPTDVEQIAGTAGAYASFGRVDINDDGVVVFEATLDAGAGYGIYTGPNPTLHKVIALGDTRDGQLFSWLRMGELNNAGQLSLLTSDYNSTDRQVWRMGGLPSRKIKLPRPWWPPRHFPIKPIRPRP